MESTKSAIVNVEREFGFPIHFRRSTNILKDQIQQLAAIKSDVQAMIDAALRNGEIIKETVRDWMRRADLVLSQATELSDEASLINSWFKGWSCGRFTIGRKAQKCINIIQELCVEGASFGATVSQSKPTQSLKLRDTEDFIAFASRVSPAEDIRKALLNDETNLVGVYGMPGVGKTALIRAIAKQMKEEQLFQEVVLVVVSQQPSLIQLQGDIAEALDLSLTGGNLSRRAEQLSERLNQDPTTTLVILDDVWERIELSEVGIPYKNNGKCCKVVFTTRFGGVCDQMEADTKIEVAILPEEDSWILFRQKSGNVEDSSLARDVLKECKGLPLAIVTLGLALRNKDAIVWEDALQQLRKSIYKGMSSVVSSIVSSYNCLESESIKICFLFCCLFPEDHVFQFDVLLNYVMGEKLLEDVDTYEEARGRLHSVMDTLASSGLLLRDEYGNLMMHVVVRDVAISIAREDHGFIVKAGRNLIDWPDMNLGNCKRLSMMYNSIERLPTIPIKAPHLQALYLNGNYSLAELPPNVFADMKCLMTLDLSSTDLKSLPPSLSCLQNLHTLLLINTHLINLSPIDKLERLEVLSLRGTTGIKGFPNLISKLQRLKEFHLLADFLPCITELREADFLREVGSLSRLTSLELVLRNPELFCHTDIPVTWENLTRFQILSGADMEQKKETRFSRSLWLDIPGKQVANWVLLLLGRTNYLQLHGCRELQGITKLGAKLMNDNLNSLSLENCHKMKCLTSNMELLESNENAFCNLVELCIDSMEAFVEVYDGTLPLRLLSNLKTLSFDNCRGLLTAIPRNLIQCLLNLKSLTVRYCPNLLYVLQNDDEEEESLVSNMSRISDSFLLPIFPNLNIVKVDWTKIRYVFTMRVARNLLQLEQLEIIDCQEMEVIFKYEDGENIKCDEDHKDSAIFPRLKILTVLRAPKLKSFTTRNLLMELPSLEILEVYGCENLERLPFGITSVPNLQTFKVLRCEEVFDKLEWEDESIKARLLPLAVTPVKLVPYGAKSSI